MFALALVLGGASPVSAQTKPAATPAPAPSPFHLLVNPTTLAGLPRVTITATDEHGHTDTYTGVSLHDFVVHAGAPSGEAVRGKAIMSAIIVGATDNYHAFFGLSEIDPTYTDHVVLIADTRDGAPLDARHGPYMSVVPFEKREARWVKNVTDVELVNLAP